jgi:Xaa-Pro dipeptidase
MATDTSLRIAPDELADRRRKLQEHLAAQDVGAVVLFGPPALHYLTGFSFVATERPMGVAMSGERVVALVPSLEREHVRAMSDITEVAEYAEYPGEEPPMDVLVRVLTNELGLGTKALAVDGDGYPSIYGYRGKPLSALLPDNRIVNIKALIEDMRLVKSAQELELLRISSRWADNTHRHLQELVADGKNEVDVSVEASLRGSRDMIRGLGPDFDPKAWSSMPTSAGFRSQIGANAAFPHAINRNLDMHRGDVLVTGASSMVWGYKCELERTMFVGPPSDEQRRWFDLMVGAQDTAFETIRPGNRCADVDRAVRAFCEQHGVTDAWRHHVGHGLGMEIHESPFLDIGDDREIRPGMVFSVEPGLYVPGLGGFRHSDTVAVTEDGIELMTKYPRDADAMVCKA